MASETENKKEIMLIVQRLLSYLTVLFLGIISFFSIKLYETVASTADQVESILIQNARYEVKVSYLEKQLDTHSEFIKILAQGQNEIKNK